MSVAVYLYAFGASSNESEHWRMVTALGFRKVYLDELQAARVRDGFYGGAYVKRLHREPCHVALAPSVLQNRSARIRAIIAFSALQ